MKESNDHNTREINTKFCYDYYSNYLNVVLDNDFCSSQVYPTTPHTLEYRTPKHHANNSIKAQ